jgi:AcrR family transcriptional regulator
LRRQPSELYRTRLLRAAAQICSEGGLESVTVARVVARAGCSRRKFYDLFADRDACLLAALEHAVERATSRVTPSHAAAGRWIDKTRAGLLALLEFFEDEPELATLCLVVAPAGGRPMLAYRAAVVHQLARVLDGARSIDRLRPPFPTAQVIVGGILETLRDRLADRDHEPLTTLLQPLMAIIVLPYFGAARASQELRRSSPQRIRDRRETAPRDRLPLPLMRLTRRTLLTLAAIASRPGMSNREVSEAAGVADQGQMSKLLSRLQRLGLVENSGLGQRYGESNAWRVTETGGSVARLFQSEL